MLLLSFAWRNALRHTHRTLLTAATVTLGTALLTVAIAWIDGVFGTMTEAVSEGNGHVRVADPRYLAREALLPLSAHLPQVTGIVQAVEGVPGVRLVAPRVVLPVTITRDDTLGDHVGLAVGSTPAWLAEVLDLDDALVSGRGLEGEDDVVLGRALANALGAKVGDELLVVGQTQDGALSPVELTLVGTVSAGTQVVDRGIFLSLARAQWMADIGEGASEVLVYADEADDAGALAERLAALPALQGLAVQPWTAAPLASSILAIAAVIRGLLAALVVGVCALAVWNTMTMSVLERTSEIGVLRAMGLGRRGVVVLFVTEALGIAAVGGVVGVALGSAGALWLQTYGVTFGERVALTSQVPVRATMYAQWGADTVVMAFSLGLVMAVVGAAAPALRAAAIQPVEAMRR